MIAVGNSRAYPRRTGRLRQIAERPRPRPAPACTCDVVPMATHIREDAPIQPVADICASIAGALDSDLETKQLAPTWDALAAKGDAFGNARRAAERTLARARAKLAVIDVSWDLEVAAFGRDMVDQSGGKRDRAPYTRFFKNVTPSAAQEFGIEREVQNGKDWIADDQTALAT